MKEKKDCRIIQDLLPNYIEKLTNEETNKYIEEHLAECTECTQILKNMQKDLEINNDNERASKEVKYMKKFNRKLKFLRNILILIVLLVAIVIGRKTIILTNISNKVSKVRDENNYHIKSESLFEGKMTISETYYKDNRILITQTIYSKDGKVTKKIIYQSGDEKFFLIDDGEKKTLSNPSEIVTNTQSYTAKNFFENFNNAIISDIRTINIENRKCYILRESNIERFIDANTGLTIKVIDDFNNYTTNFEYEYGIVKDSDITRPDTTGYTLTEFWEQR